MGENKQGTFLIFAVLLFLLNIELIKQTFLLEAELFFFELLFLIFLGIMALDSMNEFSKKNFSCFSVLSIYFGLNLVNIVGLAIFSKLSLNISMLIVACLGFLISIANINPKTEEDETEIAEPDTSIAEDLDTSNLGGGAIVTEYYPGKYLASKTGKKYHSPKCDFAKKIPENNYVWFNSETDAKKRGYGPCKCV
ncbi:hypothetical protein KY345_01440 [Candidatus Woesearchaeota archaeon]|nr:hypothetical protein [Candidatus Woesearchaeota archaeon]